MDRSTEKLRMTLREVDIMIKSMLFRQGRGKGLVGTYVQTTQSLLPHLAPSVSYRSTIDIEHRRTNITPGVADTTDLGHFLVRRSY